MHDCLDEDDDSAGRRPVSRSRGASGVMPRVDLGDEAALQDRMDADVSVDPAR